MSRPRHQQRDYWAQRLGINSEQVRKGLTEALMKQLERCQSDEARRILVGASEQQ